MRKQTAFRLKPETLSLLNELAVWNCSNRTRELERAIHLFYRLELLVRNKVNVDEEAVIRSKEELKI